MKDEYLLILAAKDMVVKTHGHNILDWSSDIWWAAVKGQLNQFNENTIITAREIYSDA
jgi:hypothetical protein